MVAEFFPIGFSMSANEASLKQSGCTSCAVTEDKSAYWTPALYFVHQNGDAELVNEVGGMLALVAQLAIVADLCWC